MIDKLRRILDNFLSPLSSNEKRFRCPHCGYVYKVPKYKIRHFTVLGKGIVRYTICPECKSTCWKGEERNVRTHTQEN